jgi:hypothetical protein
MSVVEIVGRIAIMGLFLYLFGGIIYFTVGFKEFFKDAFTPVWKRRASQSKNTPNPGMPKT